MIQTNIRSLLAQIKAYEDKAAGGYIVDAGLDDLLSQLDIERQKLDQLLYAGDRENIPGY